MTSNGKSGRGRVVVLTGGAGGIGSAIARALLAQGHSVAAVDRDREALERLMQAHVGTAAEERLSAIELDLAAESACQDAVDAALARFGRVEAVINNAGIGVSSLRPDAEARHPSIEELTCAVWDNFFDINVRAPMLVTRAGLPHMKAGGWGRIVNNTTSFLTMLRVLPYGAAKSALESMSVVWAKELAGTGITVNVLIPGGPTDTPFIAEGSGIPREGMLHPDVMGSPACWLLSEESGAMTGQRITAGRWDVSLPPAEAAAAASRAIGWPELTADVVWPGGAPNA